MEFIDTHANTHTCTHTHPLGACGVRALLTLEDGEFTREAGHM